MPSSHPPLPALAFATGWLVCLGALQWSVARYRVPIVLALLAGAVALGVWQWRRTDIAFTRASVALSLSGSAVLIMAVPMFSYLTGSAEQAARLVPALAALGCAVLLWLGRARAAAGLGAIAHIAMSAVAIRADPAPRIDVWVTLQQGAEAMARGQNVYEAQWTGSPGIQDAFTYLPWTAVLLAPGRWLVGDVRWAMLFWTLVAFAGIWVLASRHGATARWSAAAVIALLACAPGGLTQVDQAWTEPLLLAGLVWWAVLVDRGRAWWAVLPLALACASKQHLVLLLPVLLLWHPFGPRRAVATGALTGLLILPWFLAGPSAFLHDTVLLLVDFHPIRFANTLYLLSLNTFGVTPPFWATGLVVLGSLTAIGLTVHHRQPPLGTVLRWVGLLLLVATLVNKQGFYNQYWLVAAIVALSLVVPDPAPVPEQPSRQDTDAAGTRPGGRAPAGRT